MYKLYYTFYTNIEIYFNIQPVFQLSQHKDQTKVKVESSGKSKEIRKRTKRKRKQSRRGEKKKHKNS